MNSSMISEGHPTNLLYITICDEVTSQRMDAFESWLTRVRGVRDWLIQSPELIDYIDEDQSGGRSVHMFGCALRMFSALPPWGDKLPKEVDRQHLEETEFLIGELSDLSKELSCSFRLQLDRIPIGEIVDGSLDNGIQIGFLGEWRKSLSLSS